MAFTILLAALASPTDPSATLAIIHQYKAKGKVKDTILGVAALDDGLGILLFSFAIGLALALLAIVVKFALWKIQTAKAGTGVYHSDDQEGYIASGFDETLIGREREVTADLRPSGYVTVDSKRYQAVSKSGYIEKGSQVQIVSGEGAHLIVKKG